MQMWAQPALLSRFYPFDDAEQQWNALEQEARGLFHKGSQELKLDY